LIGLLIGIPAGALHAFLLAKFTDTLVKTGTPPLLFGLGVAFLPPLILIPVALLWQEAILWVGIGMSAVLISYGFYAFIRRTRKKPETIPKEEKGSDCA